MSNTRRNRTSSEQSKYEFFVALFRKYPPQKVNVIYGEEMKALAEVLRTGK